MPVSANSQNVHFDLSASVRANLLRGGGPILATDLRRKVYQRRQKALIVFAVDASESMGEGSLLRMKAAKGAVLGLLTAAYQNRDQVALVAFRGEQAQVLLRPTSSVLLAQQQLRQLPLGGATPFADGLWQAWQLIRSERQKQPAIESHLIIVSDGGANVPLVAGAEIFAELFSLAGQIAQDRIATVVIDSCAGTGNLKLRQLARKIGGAYQQIRDLHAGKLITVLQNTEKYCGPSP